MKAAGLLLLLCLSSPALAVDDIEKIDCAPEGVTDPDSCAARGCIYEAASLEGAPYCYFPEGYGYSVSDVRDTPNGLTATLTRNDGISGSFAGGDFDTLTLVAEFQSESRLRVKITPDGVSRFEVPWVISGGPFAPSSKLYDVEVVQETNGFVLRITRSSTGTVLFDTSLPGFVYSDQFIQIPTRLPTTNVYGLGENEQHSYKHDFNWVTWAAYGRDQPPSYTANMYGTHPTYTVLEEDGNAHSVLFLNSAAQEWTFTPNPSFVYKTIGGVLDMYFFLGPSPSECNQQYSEVIGRYPMPPYWSLGFHLCRFGYNSLDQLQAAVDRTAEFDIPQDAQWGDIDIMDRRLDFTVSADNFGGLPDYVRELKSQNIRFVTILDPCIATDQGDGYRPYALGNDMDVWVKRSDGTNVVGKVWPDGPIHFADYSNPSAKEWWRTLITEFHDTLEFDALWIDMNEPANFVTGDMEGGCADNTLNYPPYKPRTAGDQMADKTICGDHQHFWGSHYDTHNMYGFSQSDATYQGVEDGTGNRGWVLSRSTFVGSGNYVAHWLGDNFANWANLKYSIIGMLQFNRFAIPHVGADICGFIDSPSEELCSRWHELGAFYPFSRNHNGENLPDQDPGAFGQNLADLTRRALHYRYRFIPYLYTLFFKHQTTGTSVARALWDEFPTDANTWAIDEQFLWGNGLLISPVVEEGATSKVAYFPDARWYEITNWLIDGSISEIAAREATVTLDAPLDILPLHVRGGVAFPLQEEARNTELARANPWILLFALDDDEAAEGDLFMDDGVSQNPVGNGQYFLANFRAVVGALSYSVTSNAFSGMSGQTLGTVEVVGVRSASVARVFVNGAAFTDFVFNVDRLTLNNVNLPMDQDFTVTYF